MYALHIRNHQTFYSVRLSKKNISSHVILGNIKRRSKCLLSSWTWRLEFHKLMDTLFLSIFILLYASHIDPRMKESQSHIFIFNFISFFFLFLFLKVETYDSCLSDGDAIGQNLLEIDTLLAGTVRQPSRRASSGLLASALHGTSVEKNENKNR